MLQVPYNCSVALVVRVSSFCFNKSFLHGDRGSQRIF
jgi:hypothetical protein